MEAKNLAEMHHTPQLDWSRIKARLQAGVSQGPGTGGPDRHTCWLATTNADGSPHVTGAARCGPTAPSGSRPARAPARAGTWPATHAAR